MINKNFLKVKEIARRNNYELIYLDRHTPMIGIIDFNTKENKCEFWKIEKDGFINVAEFLLRNALNEEYLKKTTSRVDYFDVNTLHSVVDVFSDTLFLVDIIDGFYSLEEKEEESDFKA
ncbi:MAG: hypothetical protein ACRC5T_01225 [Cetobacterium sp.]